MPSPKHRKISYEGKKSIAGFMFVLPWLIGFIFFFGRFMVQSLLYSLSKVKITPNGLNMSFVGLQNYRYAFSVDPHFIRMLSESLVNMLYNVPLILMFSLFIAYLLSQKFRGRTTARAVFFLPVIITTGVVIDVLKGDTLAQQMLSGQGNSMMFQATALQNILIESGYGVQVVNFMVKMVNNIFEISWKSGIQILLFMAGLQSIPRTLYEASDIEGATAWEKFWKVTFPMLTPIVLLNIIYSIIDSFSDYSNQLIKLVFKYSKELNIDYSAALAWSYFAIIFLVIGVVYLIINRKVFYVVD